MPKSKRPVVVHMTRVSKKSRESKNELFGRIRACAEEHPYIYVLRMDNMRNTHLQSVRSHFRDSRLFLGKTKLMSRALGHDPSSEVQPGVHLLTPHISGTIALLFTPRPPAEVSLYFSTFSPVDFARAGAVAPRSFHVPPGLVYSTGGEVPPSHDVPISHTVEPELRKLGVPVRMLRGKVVLGGDESGEGSEGYVVCKAGETLDARQTRLLRIFSVCMAEFRVRIVAYWSANNESVTEVDVDRMEE